MTNVTYKKFYHSMHKKLGKFGSEENPTFFYVTGWKKSQIKKLAMFCKWISDKVLQKQFTPGTKD